MPPLWVIVLFVVCLLLVLLLIGDGSKPLADFFIHSETAKLIATAGGVVAFVVILGTAVQILLSLDHMREDKEARRDERIERAFTRLLLPSGGNIGKGSALNTLASEQMSLDKFDLSCRAIGRWNEANQVCVKRPLFADVRIGPNAKEQPAGNWLGAFVPQKPSTPSNQSMSVASLRPSYFGVSGRDERYSAGASGMFTGLDLTQTDFENVTIEKLWLNEAILAMASFTQFDFQLTRISGNFRDARFSWGDLSFSELIGNLEGSRVEYANVSGLILVANRIEEDPFPKLGPIVWAWADYPPMPRVRAGSKIDDKDAAPVIDAIMKWFRQIKLCDPASRIGGSRRLEFATDRAESGDIATIAGRAGGFSAGFACEELDLETAMEWFPDAYRVGGRLYDWAGGVDVYGSN